MLVLIDNYDSFVHNLARYFERLGQETLVLRNDAIDSLAIQKLRPDGIVLSPGPCTPREAGASLEIVRQLHLTVPMLGVCLGHQIIANALGAKIVRAPVPMHGQASAIRHTGHGLFNGLPLPLCVGRYHSLVVDSTSLPSELRATAWSEDGVLMAFEHSRASVFGVQFHPESILTEFGYELLSNFLRKAQLGTGYFESHLSASELRQARPMDSPLPTAPVTF